MKKIFQFLVFTSLFIYPFENNFAQKPQLIIPAAHAEKLNCAIFSPDNKMLITGGSEVTKIWDIASQRLYTTISGQSLHIALSPNGKMLAIVGVLAVQFVSLETFEVVKVVQRNENDGFWTGCFSVDGKSFYVGGGGYQHAYIWAINMSDFQMKQVVDVEDTVTYNRTFNPLAVSPDGKYLMGYLEALGTNIYNTKTWELVKKMPAEIGAIAFSPDGSILARTIDKTSECGIGIYKLLDANTLKIKQEFKITEGKHCLFWENKIHFSKTGSDILINDDQYIWYYDVKSKTVKKVFQRDYTQEAFDITAISHDGNYFVKGSASPKLYSLPDGKEISKFGSPVFSMLNMATSPVKSEMMVGSLNYKVKLIDLQADGFHLRSFNNQNSTTSLNFSPNGKTAMVGRNDAISLLDLTKPNLNVQTVNFKNRTSPKSSLFSPDGRLLANVHDDQISMVDVVNKKIIFEKRDSGKYSLPIHKKLGGFSPDGKQFIYMSLPQDKLKKGYDAEPNIYCIDTQSGAIIWNQKYAASGFKFMPDGKNIVAYDELNVMNRHNKVFIINALNGEKTQEWDLRRDSSDIGFVVSEDAKTVLNSNKQNGIDVYDVEKQALVASILGHQIGVQDMAFLKNNRFAVSIGYDNYIRFYDVEKKTQLANMVIFEDTNDWAVFTSDGRFDASPEALKTMYFVKGKDFISLEALSEKFYTPKLLQSLLEGVDLGPAPVNIDDVKSPPSVKIMIDNKQRNLTVEDDNKIPSYDIDNEQVTIKIQADCPSDVVTEIRLFQNGKLIGSTRNLVVDDDKISGEKSLQKTFSVVLNEGENVFKAIAINSQRTESKPDEVILNYKAKSSTPSISGINSSNAQLYVVVIGINKYKNPKYNLNYATADATSFKEAIEKTSSTIFTKTNVAFIGDDKATKVGIVTELDKIKATANAKDVFIFYYAGHGVLNEKKEFFLVPHDVTQLYGADDALTQKGLSANQLQQFSKDIKAQKQLFILDACQSAGALDQVMASRGAAEEKAISQLARSTGTHWLTASGSEQFASEFQQLGHGTFTYVLLEALSGKADLGGDKKITVKELDAYLQEQVPELTAKYKGTPQFPASYGFGNDFPIGVVKN